MKNPVVFLDFQGTLGGEGVDDIRNFQFYPWAIEAIKILNKNNIVTIGITNQSRISKGEFTMDEYQIKLQSLKDELFLHHAYLDAVFCCPHSTSDNCKCKKPLTGMIDMAKREIDINMEKAYVVGDMGMTDMVLANKINAKGILVLTGVGKGSLNEFRHTWRHVEPDYIAENVLEAVQWIVGELEHN